VDRNQEARKCLHALGSAWRYDWSDFDGRTLRGQLDEIDSVLSGKMTYKKFLLVNDIDPITLSWVD
jgi:hypothetical protein